MPHLRQLLDGIPAEDIRLALIATAIATAALIAGEVPGDLAVGFVVEVLLRAWKWIASRL